MRKLLYISTVHQVETFHNMEAIYTLVLRVPVGTYTTMETRDGLHGINIIFMINLAIDNFTSFIVTTGWTVEVPLPEGARFFSSPRRPDRFWGPHQPLIHWISGVLTPRVKRLEREADHSPPTSAKVKNTFFVVT
jgi:hypothetical protein